MTAAQRIHHNTGLAILLFGVSSTSFATLEDGTCESDLVASSTPSARFTLMGDDVVRDDATNLEWQRCSLGQSWDGTSCDGNPRWFTWREALEVAQTVPGWRLPDLQELRSIVEECRTFPTINLAVFPGTQPGSGYWTSTPTTSLSFAWGVTFAIGTDSRRVKNELMSVRLVRGAQEPLPQ